VAIGTQYSELARSLYETETSSQKTILRKYADNPDHHSHGALVARIS